FRAEREVADGVLRLLHAPARPLEGLEQAIARFERETKLKLAPAQRVAVEAAARQKLVVVTGGPGVGKTTIVRAILRTLGQAKLDTRLAAPTGRAAKRLSEATGHEASTLHRLLEWSPQSGRFERNEERPLAADLLVVDEVSMLDMLLAHHLLKAVP